MTEVKGTAVKSIAEFVKSKFGEENYQKWIESLPPESANIFQGMILPTSWFPLEESYNIPLKKVSDMFFGGDDKKAGWEAGVFSADTALKGIYKFFVKVGSPKFVMHKASSILPTYYRPSAMEDIDNGEFDIIIRMTQFEGVSVMAENRIAGWIHTASSVSGAKNVKVDIVKSMARGDDCTDFRVTWE